MASNRRILPAVKFYLVKNNILGLNVAQRFNSEGVPSVKVEKSKYFVRVPAD
jgi:hypothetical protein